MRPLDEGLSRAAGELLAATGTADLVDASIVLLAEDGDAIVTADAVYAFGKASYHGGANTLSHLNAPIVGISVDPATGGYWLVGADGTVHRCPCPEDLRPG